ncbi:proteasome subunit alpha type-7-b [Phtheirospermum japonicum]|uniref:Proteasome subunit alpha type-7-b n=1 Tax=Phtheirospermum japonicum TaxID=374723 RepID=A0A830CHP8_9LAMI|nr:proteasome subunit alpha type-7-b [Phtheirospermum japonicum]
METNKERTEKVMTFLMAKAIKLKSNESCQVLDDYALEASSIKGNVVIGIRGSDTISLIVEKKSAPKLRDSRFQVPDSVNFFSEC